MSASPTMNLFHANILLNAPISMKQIDTAFIISAALATNAFITQKHLEEDVKGSHAKVMMSALTLSFKYNTTVTALKGSANLKSTAHIGFHTTLWLAMELTAILTLIATQIFALQIKFAQPCLSGLFYASIFSHLLVPWH